MTRPQMSELAQAIADASHMLARFKNMNPVQYAPDERDRQQAALALARLDAAVKPLYEMIG